MKFVVNSKMGSFVVLPLWLRVCLSRNRPPDQLIYGQTRITDTRLVWTPHYYLRTVRFVYGQFALSLEERKPLHFLSIQPALYGDLVNYGPLSVRINEI